MLPAREHVSFAIVVPRGGLRALSPTLRRVFSHPWVASYMIGFGPPLIKSTPRIVERLKGAKSALDKLEIYIEECLINEEERKRYTTLHRKLMTKSRGPLEANELDEASAEVIDLSIRLHHPALAIPAVSQAMRARGVSLDVVPMHSPPDDLSARIMVRIADPRGTRFLDTKSVHTAIDEEVGDALAIELRCPPAVRGLYASFLSELGGDVTFVHFSDPAPLTRVIRDGEKS
jgi:hypothetical protein